MTFFKFGKSPKSPKKQTQGCCRLFLFSCCLPFIFLGFRRNWTPESFYLAVETRYPGDPDDWVSFCLNSSSWFRTHEEHEGTPKPCFIFFCSDVFFIIELFWKNRTEAFWLWKKMVEKTCENILGIRGSMKLYGHFRATTMDIYLGEYHPSFPDMVRFLKQIPSKTNTCLMKWIQKWLFCFASCSKSMFDGRTFSFDGFGLAAPRPWWTRAGGTSTWTNRWEASWAPTEPQPKRCKNKMPIFSYVFSIS